MPIARSVSVLPMMLALLVGQALGGEAAPGDGSQGVKLDASACRPLVPVHALGERLFFGLQLGSARTIVDTKLPKILRGKAPGAQRNEEEGASSTLIPLPPLTFGTETLCKVHARSIDLQVMSVMNGQFMAGVLGSDAFAGKALQVDFDRARVLLLESDKLNAADLGTAFDLGMNKDGDLTIKASLDGLDGDVEFGLSMTGDVSALRTQTFRAYAERSGIEVRVANGASVSGITEDRFIRVRRLKFGPETRDNVVFCEGGRYSILGLDFLSRYLVTMDYKTCRLYLKKREGPALTNEMMSGLMAGRDEKRTFALGVRKDGPAWNAGIRPDDTILKIDGREAGGVTMGEILRILNSGDGKSVEIEISTKGGEAVKRTMVLKKLL